MKGVARELFIACKGAIESFHHEYDFLLSSG
jgi:hypothetical protein